MKVSIIKYNAGNVYSVECALRRLGVTPVVSDSPDVLSQSDKVLFPGVGEASSAMKYLQEHGIRQGYRRSRAAGVGYLHRIAAFMQTLRRRRC